MQHRSIWISAAAFICWMTGCLTLSAQQPIKIVKALPLGAVVTTTGTITTGNTFGTIRYMQDHEAGIAVFDTQLNSTKPGDSILITGVLSMYKGQVQISSVFSWSLISQGNGLPIPKEISLGDTSSQYESMLITLPCAGIATCESVFEDGWYRIFDQKGREGRLISEGDVHEGNSIPAGGVNITGILTFSKSRQQILLLELANTSEETCSLIFPPQQMFIFGQPSFFWNVDSGGEYFVQYGTDEFDHSESAFASGNVVEHPMVNLPSGHIFKVRLGMVTEKQDTIYSLPEYFTPSSAVTEMDVFFNRSIDASFSDGSAPDGVGSSVIETDVIERIDQVTSTLDVAMYNSSRDNIIQAVKRAVQRGVQVRYIADDETSNSALTGLTFPVIYRTGDGIMHNKFIIGDAAMADRAWLWTGSTNHSANQLSSDPNNALIFHNQHIALSYEREFNEMWGSDALYGEQKENNTAHHFLQGERVVHSYFSPSDETSCHIKAAIEDADHHLEIALLLLTKQDLVDAIIAKHQAGVKVRVILEDEKSSSLAISRFQQAGVPVITHHFGNIFHHKYAIIDEGHYDSWPTLITGSHNWTFSADNINDENTLIIQDQSLANIYRQEFEARWKELGGAGTNQISFEEIQLVPNPVSGHLSLTNPRERNCTITVINQNGIVIDRLKIAAGQHLDYKFPHQLTKGTYILHWKWPDHIALSKIVVQ